MRCARFPPTRFPFFFDEWGLDAGDICGAWDNKGDTVIGNDVWIGYEAVILSGVKIGDGAIIGARRGDKGRAALYHRRRRARQTDPQAL